MTPDWLLLRRYAQEDSQEAFATLTARYLNLVYSVCLREVHDPELAQEVTQAVFLLLARTAPAFRSKTALPGWLFRTARFAAQNARTREQRRRHHEGKAALAMQQESEGAENAAWSEIEPVLNDALAALRERDRECVLLRFFQGLSFSEAGAALGLSEEAARKRVGRALEKMRAFFGKEGVIVPVAVLAVLLPVHAAKAAPLGLMEAAGHVNAGLMASRAYDLSEGVWRAMRIAKIKAMTVAAVVVAGLSAVLPLAARTHRVHPATVPQVSYQPPAAAIGPVVADPTVLAIMREGLLSEASIRSGRVTLSRVTVDLPLDEALLRKSIKDPRALAAILEHQLPVPRRVIDGMQITFDNSRQELLYQGTNSYQGTSSYQMEIRKVLYTPRYTKNYRENRDAAAAVTGGQDTFVEKPDTWPNSTCRAWIGGDWQLWAAAVAAGKIKPRLLKNDPKTGQACLFFLGPPDGVDQTVWVDRRRGCLVTRLAATLKHGGRVVEDHTISYERTPQGLWYPARFVRNVYSYIGGTRHLYRRETTTAKAMELNVALSDLDFEFGAITRNSFVQDNRFDPPLTYIQKEKQFTDQELQAMAKARPAAPPIAVP